MTNQVTNPPFGSATLADDAIGAVRRAATNWRSHATQIVEERNVWQPDTWLMQRTWMALAESGAALHALEVARLASKRQPLAPIQAVHRLAMLVTDRSDLVPLVSDELRAMHGQLFAKPGLVDVNEQAERLVLAASSGALIGYEILAFACLEQLDQHARAWDCIFPNPTLRNQLAGTVARISPHPLTIALIRSSIRRFGDAGAHFLQRVAEGVAAQMVGTESTPASARLLLHCVETVRYASLTTLHSHRVATAVLAHGGLADEVASHLTTIANIQEARRESGLALRKNDQSLLRQVKRPQADADIDFQVYTLQEAIRAMPVRQITREQRIELSQRLATLGMRSDGWTAAGAAATLVELGALKFATEVVDHIAFEDPTRSEGAIALVNGLLAMGEIAMATEQSQKALAWAKSVDSQNAERATIWGLAEVYLLHEMPDEALALVGERSVVGGLFYRLRGVFQSEISDDELRDDRLRLQAFLQQNAYMRPVDQLFAQLQTWAPRLLDGEALIGFYLDGLLAPLLASGRFDLAKVLLPDLCAALVASGGSKHATHVGHMAALLTQQIQSGEIDDSALQMIQTTARELWREDVQKGVWQTVHAIEGSLPLILVLEGPNALVTIARTAESEGASWVG